MRFAIEAGGENALQLAGPGGGAEGEADGVAAFEDHRRVEGAGAVFQGTRIMHTGEQVEARGVIAGDPLGGFAAAGGEALHGGDGRPLLGVIEGYGGIHLHHHGGRGQKGGCEQTQDKQCS